MNNSKFVYCLLAGMGGGMMGFCAEKLNEPLGILLFTCGAALLSYSVIKASNTK